MYSSELPACSIEQVTKMSDGAFLSIKDTHHLFVGVYGRKKSHVIHHTSSLNSTFAYLPKCPQGRLACSHGYEAMVAEEREAPRLGSPVWQVPR